MAITNPENLNEVALAMACLETGNGEAINVAKLAAIIAHPPADGAKLGVACFLRDQLADGDPPITFNESEAMTDYIICRGEQLAGLIDRLAWKRTMEVLTGNYDHIKELFDGNE